ncbi:ATP-binding protein [Motilimonas pumila]|nr:ATP-binding protein [Motilimonas pumila]
MRPMKDISFRAKLSVAFLLLSITPIAVIAAVFHFSFVSNNEKQAYDTLFAIAQNKQATLQQHMQGLRQQALHFSNTDFVRYAMSRFYGFSYAFDLIDDSPDKAAQLLRDSYTQSGHFKALPSKLGMTVGSYNHVYERFDDGFSDFIGSSDFSDILLVNPTGRVVYSNSKGVYFTADLTSTAYRNTPLSELFFRLSESLAPNSAPEVIVFSDFIVDPKSHDIRSYLLLPVKNHEVFSGYIAFVLPPDALANMMASRQGLGATGESYLVNQAGIIFSHRDSREAERAKFPVELNASIQAQKGVNGVMKAVNYKGQATFAAYTFSDFLNTRWSIIAEQSASEVQASNIKFRNLIIFIGLLSAAVMTVMIYLIALSLTRPLHSLMLATKAVTEGNWHKKILGTSRRDEIGQLASQFSLMQQAIRQQLQVIGDTNQQLEQQVALINQQNEQLVQADKIKDEFLTNTSHELRTPLTGVIGITESLLNGVAGPCNEQQSQQLHLALSGAQRLAHLVDDLTDFHQIKDNRLRIQLQPVAVLPVVQRVFELAKHNLSNPYVELHADLPKQDHVVIADSIRLEQVLHNLLSNAMKYTRRGQITLTVKAARGHVSIAVTDSGIGIAESDLAVIFEPFKQVDGSETRTQGGSGLGLAISQQLVQLMGGQLACQSELGQGSRFEFCLPMTQRPVLTSCEQALNQRQSLLVEPVSLLPSAVKGELQSLGQVLVVDDEAMNLQVIHNHLSLAGYQTQLCQDGQQALTLLAQQPFDLLILDVMLPSISGFEVAIAIRAQQGLVDLPILMLTAKTRTKDVLRGFQVGANDYLMKPFLQDELLARVGSLIRAKQSQQHSEENKRLKQQMAKHIEVEQMLQQSQQNMQHMLAQVEDAIININPFQQVVFCNYAAVKLLGCQECELLGADISTFFMAAEVNQLLANLNQRGQLEARLTLQRGEQDARALQVSASLISAYSDYAEISLVCHELGDELSTLSAKSNVDNGQALHCEQLIESDYRQDLVTVMNHALALWNAAGHSKVELAEQSKIWSVYLDRSSAQTRTLDKYLLLETLPKKPRWRDVLRTATFVKQNVAVACGDKESQGYLAQIEISCEQIKRYINCK